MEMVFYLICGLTLLVVSKAIALSLRDYRRGYSIEVSGGCINRLVYKEIGKTALLLFVESGCPATVYVPSKLDWQNQVPDWATERRQEIMQRIIKELGSKDFTYLNYSIDM